MTMSQKRWFQNPETRKMYANYIAAEQILKELSQLNI